MFFSLQICLNQLRSHFKQLGLAGLLVLGLGIGLNGCSSPDIDADLPANAKVLKTEVFEGWQFYKYDNIRIFHPPDHPYESEFASIAAGYQKALADITKLLEQPYPQDTIIIVYYADNESAMAITAKNYPFVSDDIIHFWQPSYYGPTLVRWYLPHWVANESRHRFLSHGLMTLFDYSGQDYHAATLQFIDEDRFIPLASLAIDSRINSDLERHLSTEAASFCAFMIAWHGADIFEAMYRYEGSFEEFVQGAFSLEVDSLEAYWLEVIRANQAPEISEPATP